MGRTFLKFKPLPAFSLPASELIWTDFVINPGEKKKAMTEWMKHNEILIKEFGFKNFSEAMQFVNEVAGLAEANNHHPDITLYGYKNVRITLSTHSEGKVTEKDYMLAGLIDKLR